jgi:DNA polymerase-1
MSSYGLAKDLNIPAPQAQEFIDTYFARYPKVKEYIDRVIKECEKNGFVTTILNRRRYIPDINSKNNAIRQLAQRQAINTPVQGSAADFMKLAMLKVQEAMEKQKMASAMMMTVHDELVFDVVKDEQKAMIALVREEMESPIKLSVPVAVTIKVGMNWLQTKEV